VLYWFRRASRMRITAQQVVENPAICRPLRSEGVL
jgi:hypothetical protein